MKDLRQGPLASNDLSHRARTQIKAARFQAWLCEKLGDRTAARDWRMVANCFISAARKLREASHE